MKRKLRIGILFGGKSAEHEISILSARNIATALDKNKYEAILIGITKKGCWHFLDNKTLLLPAERNGPKLKALTVRKAKNCTLNLSREKPFGDIDVIFPVLHGPFGEDGTIQGLLKLANVPFIGAGVLGSALGMDKDAMKRLLRERGIPVAKFLTIHRADFNAARRDYKQIVKQLGLPLFVKPANLGSSVGVSKVKNKKQFAPALREAFRYDNKILIEECVSGRELECAVLGNEKPVASVPGEIIPQHEFYSYEAKYLDDNGAILKIPADLPKEIVEKVRNMAVRAFTTLCCEGMARVDFFLKKNNEVLVNEINTIPGFTKISMYPKLWEASGVSYSELMDKLIQLAIERFKKESCLKT